MRGTTFILLQLSPDLPTETPPDHAAERIDPPSFAMYTFVPFRGSIMFQRTVNEFLQVENFQARPDDVLIVAYPKTGIHWMGEIVDMIYQGGDTEKCSKEPIYHRVPFLEIFSTILQTEMKLVTAMPSPRLIKTHLPAQLIPESFWKNKCKIIYMVRNAKDVAVSAYFFFSALKTTPSIRDWADFLEKFMAGEVLYGSWYDHVIGWWKKQENPNILYVFYEDMKENPKGEIKKMAKFLQKDLEEEIVNKIVHQTSFKAMKENPMSNFEALPSSHLDQGISPFLRKGMVGDWKNQFTVAQNEKFDEQYKKKMTGIRLPFQAELCVPQVCPTSSGRVPTISDKTLIL